MKKILCILLLLAMPLSADMITRDALDDNMMLESAPNTNYGTITYMRLGKVSALKYHGWFGDSLIDNDLLTYGEIVVDSALYIFNIQGKFYFGTGETLKVSLRGCDGNKFSVENEQNWTRWKVGSNWEIAGGDTTATISDTILIPSRAVATGWDTLHVIRVGSHPYAGLWLDSLISPTWNTGAFLICDYVTADNQLYIDVWSEQASTLQPYLEIYFRIVEAETGYTKYMGKGPKGRSSW